MSKALLSNEVSTSDKLAHVSDQAALLWTWLLTHVDTWGQMDGSPGTVEARVVPRRGWGEEKVSELMGELHDVGLIQIYNPRLSHNFPETPGNSGKENTTFDPSDLPEQVLIIKKWERFQRFDRRRKNPQFPMPSKEQDGSSGKFPELPGKSTLKGREVKGSEGKGKEPKHTDHSSNDRTPKNRFKYSDEFEKFWDAYPRSDNKKKAFEAWGKVIGNGHENETLIAAVVRCKRDSPEWKRGIVPHATTWLNGERWEDQFTLEKTEETDSDAIRRAAFRGVGLPLPAENGNRGSHTNPVRGVPSH